MKTVLTARVLAVCVLLASLSSMSFAQRMGGGPGGGNRMGPNVMGMVGRKDVQRDLKMTAAQVKSFTALQEQMMKDMRRDPNAPRPTDRNAMRAKMEAFEKRAEAILTAAQRARLKQIALQLQGNRVLLSPDIQKQLGITSAQKQRIDAMSKAHRAELQKLMESIQNNRSKDGAIQAPGSFQKLEAANTKLEKNLGTVLTAAQRTKLNTMRGAPFKADAAPARMPSGGRPSR